MSTYKVEPGEDNMLIYAKKKQPTLHKSYDSTYQKVK